MTMYVWTIMYQGGTGKKEIVFGSANRYDAANEARADGDAERKRKCWPLGHGYYTQVESTEEDSCRGEGTPY